MNKLLKYFIICILVMAWWLYRPADLNAEFYKYVDRQGRVFYVDDLSKIPEEYQEQVKVYREKYDNLPEADRSRAVEQSPSIC